MRSEQEIQNTPPSQLTTKELHHALEMGGPDGDFDKKIQREVEWRRWRALARSFWAASIAAAAAAATTVATIVLG